jgi:phage baseplate assembly protein W
MVLSRIHDPVDGMEISAESSIDDHVCDLLSTSIGNRKPIPEFVCFGCPEQLTDLVQFQRHCATRKHLSAIKGKLFVFSFFIYFLNI